MIFLLFFSVLHSQFGENYYLNAEEFCYNGISVKY